MSFQKPSGDVIALTSGDMSIAGGTLRIDLNLRDADSAFGDSYIIDVLDIGGIEVDYNYLEEVADITDFKINVPSFEFEIRDLVANSNSSSDTGQFVDMVTRLDAADLIVGKITFNGRSDFYFTTRSQTEFSYANRRVKFSMQHPLKYGVEPYGKTWSAAIFSSPSKYIPVSLDDGSNPIESKSNSLFPRDLLEEYLDILSDSSVTQIYSDIYNRVYTDTPSNGDKEFVLVGSGLTQRPDTNFQEATSAVKGMALSECAIVGNMLGYSFYVPRYKKDNAIKVTFDSDDFEEIELDYSFKDVNTYSQTIRYGDTSLDFIDLAIGPETINDIGTNNVTVTYSGIYRVSPSEYSLLESAYLFGNQQYNALPNTFTSNVEAGFKDVFRIPRSIGATDAGSYISGKIFGIETLKPYEYFTVSSGVHPLVDGRDFRPSYLKYDLKNDIIEFEAYEF